LKHKAVVLLNFGGPRNLDEVEGFVYEILRDPNTLQVPFPQWGQNLLAARIARRRGPEVRAQYGVIGGKSPIVEATRTIALALAGALAGPLAAEGPSPASQVRVYAAHRYLPGWAEDTARQAVADGMEELLLVPLYPHFSYTTTGSSLAQFGAALARAGFRGRVTALRGYADHPSYLDAMEARLKETLQGSGLSPKGTLVLCSAHGLPRVYVRRGDPYVDELNKTMEGLRARFRDWTFLLSFQSRVGPMEWLKPYTDQVIPTLPGQGVRQLVFLPLAFVNDHIETLYEVGHTYFQLAKSHGLVPYRVGAVEAHPAFISALADITRQWLKDNPPGQPKPAGGKKAKQAAPQWTPRLLPLEVLLPPSQWRRRHLPWIGLVLAAGLLVAGLLAAGTATV